MGGVKKELAVGGRASSLDNTDQTLHTSVGGRASRSTTQIRYCILFLLCGLGGAVERGRSTSYSSFAFFLTYSA